MPTPPLTRAAAREAIRAVEKALRDGHRPPGKPGHGMGAVRVAAKAMGVPTGTLENRLRRAAELYAVAPDWGVWKGQAPAARSVDSVIETLPLPDRLLAALRRRPAPVTALAGELVASEADVKAAIATLRATGFNLTTRAGNVTLDRAPLAAVHAGAQVRFLPRERDTYCFGLTGDQHLGSRYERLDVLEALYDAFAAEGVQAVWNTGNWIDGEASFNRHDLHVHGMDGQLAYMAKAYPRRKGIVTYAVAGDDHEGWYSQREGVDIGRYAARVMRDAGRDDWVDLGFMEAPVTLRNADSGREAMALVAHPGGGSAYALSYSVQKIIESLDGGEKPAVWVGGHYHKLWSGNIRNVWAIQTGCCQDQTPFMRKKKLEAHVGGAIVWLTQDPATGAIVRCRVELLRWFVKGYYAARWGRSGDVAKAPRLLGGTGA